MPSHDDPSPTNPATAVPRSPAPHDPAAAPPPPLGTGAGPLPDIEGWGGALSTDPAAYAPIDGPHAEKLASSAIPPAVAWARGYAAVHAPTLGAAREAARALGANLRTKQGQRIVRAIVDGGVLAMPWHLPGHDAPSALQWRPARPEPAPDGRDRKYEFTAGDRSPVGVHPSVPLSWVADPSVPLLIAEGLLKGDAALAAWLAASAPGAAALDTATPDTARSALRDLIAAVPDGSRVCVATVGGVGNWHSNPEWAMYALDGRDVWIGFDADVAANPDVWREAERLSRFLADHGARAISYMVPGGPGSKIGIDDYLSNGGTWEGLLASMADELPDRPARPETGTVGSYRVSADGTCVEFCEPVRDDSGRVVSGRWARTWSGPGGLPQSLPMGGRVEAVHVQRLPTPQEDATGDHGAGHRDGAEERAEVVLEIQWAADDGAVVSGQVVCDFATLNTPPEKWGASASIDKRLALHPEWPPRGAAGTAWLRAVKAHRADETEWRTVWTRDGWVPVADGRPPVFLVGDQCVGDDDGTAGVLSAASKYMPRSGDYGCGPDDPRGLDDAAYRAELAGQARRVVEGFYRAFTVPGAASALMACMLRPVVSMVQPRASLYFSGPPGKGKSWSQSLPMAGWASRPAAFDTVDGQGLPGSAEDTGPAREAAVSAAVIYGIDDVAPSSSGRQAADKRAAAEDALRRSFSGAARQKMRNDGTGWVRDEGRPPHAVIMTTAENDPDVESIESRVIRVAMLDGALPASRQPTDDLDFLMHKDLAGARLVRGFVKFLRECSLEPVSALPPDTAGASGWARQVACVREHRVAFEIFSQLALKRAGVGGNVKREAQNVADLCAALPAFGQFLDRVGADPSMWAVPESVRSWMLEARSDGQTAGGGLPGAMWRTVVDMVAADRPETVLGARGARLLEAVRLLLASGQAHVTDAADPVAVPGGSDRLASSLGWAPMRDQMVPRGDSVGVCGTGPDGRLCLALNSDVVFVEVARRYPHLVPHGSVKRSWWRDVRQEGLLAPGFEPRGDSGVSARGRLSGAVVTGAFVLAETLLGADAVGGPRGPWDEALDVLGGDE